jgi:hypothetical protein
MKIRTDTRMRTQRSVMLTETVPQITSSPHPNPNT